MKHFNLVYKLNTSAESEANGINLFLLAPILLSFAALIKEANNTINPQGREITVNVRPFHEGSFVIDIILFAQNRFQDILDCFSSHEAEQIRNLLEFIGLVGASTVSVFKVIKFLKGRPKKVYKISDQEYEYQAESGESMTVPEKTHLLMKNCSVGKFIYQSFGVPLENNLADKINLYEENNVDSLVEINQMDSRIIKSYSESQLTSEEMINQDVYFCELIIKKPDLIGKSRWDFIWNKTIAATIVDDEFLNQIKNGEILVSGGYKLVCDMKIKFRIDNEYNPIAEEYIITKVHRVKPKDSQEQAQKEPSLKLQ